MLVLGREVDVDHGPVTYRVGWRHATVMIPYNDVWKIHRKNITKITSTSTSLSVFDCVQEAEAARFLVNMLESPDRLFEHVRKEAGSVILKITYGYNIVPHGKDPLVDVAEKTMEQFAEATVPGRWAVDIFPFSSSCSFLRDYRRVLSNLVSEIHTRLDARCRLQTHSKGNGKTARSMHNSALPIRQAANARKETYTVLPLPKHRKHR
jgi:hypothetical protein